MSMIFETDVAREKLREWLVNFVTLFRSEYEKLSEDGKLVLRFHNYNAPLQLEVIWLKQPEFQLIISTHFPDRDDREIIINGPFEGSEFVDKVESVLKEKRWDRVFKSDLVFIEETERKYADILAADVFHLINNAKNSVFSNYKKPMPFGGVVLGEDGWIQEYFGNIAETDYVQSVRQLMAQTRSYSSEKPAEPVKVERPQWIKSYAAIIFPPVVIGKKPEPTIREKMLGIQPLFGWDERVLDTKFSGVPVIVNKDGFIGVGHAEKNLVLKILNVIMATMTIEGIPAVAVRENELSETNLHPEGFYFSGYSIPTSTLRGYLFEERWSQRVLRYHERREIEPKKIKEIVEKARKIFESGEIGSDLILLVEAYTHYEDTEYSQSFIMSWIIIERDIMDLWERIVEYKKPNSRRKGKLLKQWTLDDVLETLNINGQIDDEKYSTLVELKNKRNAFIHPPSKELSKEDALKCFEMTTEIVKRKVSSMLTEN